MRLLVQMSCRCEVATDSPNPLLCGCGDERGSAYVKVVSGQQCMGACVCAHCGLSSEASMGKVRALTNWEGARPD